MQHILECKRWQHAKKKICDLCRYSDSCIIVAQLLQPLNSASGYGLYTFCISKTLLWTSMNSKKVRTYQSVTTPTDSLYFHFLRTKFPSCGCHMTRDVQIYWLALCSTRSIVYAWCPAWNFWVCGWSLILKFLNWNLWTVKWVNAI